MTRTATNNNSAGTASGAVRGLYAITPDEPDTATLLLKVGLALEGGARLVQYRNKHADAALRRSQAVAILMLCQQYRVPLIINDHVDLTLDIGADGVHLGGEDGDWVEARRMLDASRSTQGLRCLLGASCYNRIELAHSACDAGADYVAFGAAFASTTKPGAVSAPLDLYRQGTALGLPVVAIGGITANNARALIDNGVAAVAVITDLFNARDVAARARQFAKLFSTS